MKNTFFQKIISFFENMECFVKCVSDDTEVEIEKIIEYEIETKNDRFILKKNDEVFHLIGIESIKI